MIHLGIKRLIYTVKFDSSCYYPVTFEKKKTKLLFGLSFGWFWDNSISILWRPSERLEQIDLFAQTIMNGTNTFTSFIGTIDTNKLFSIKIKTDCEYNMYWIIVSDSDSGHKHLSYSSNFKYPMIKFGYTIARKNNYNILLERN